MLCPKRLIPLESFCDMKNADRSVAMASYVWGSAWGE
jgi:hypothetical protein